MSQQKGKKEAEDYVWIEEVEDDSNDRQNAKQMKVHIVEQGVSEKTLKMKVSSESKLQKILDHIPKGFFSIPLNSRDLTYKGAYLSVKSTLFEVKMEHDLTGIMKFTVIDGSKKKLRQQQSKSKNLAVWIVHTGQRIEIPVSYEDETLTIGKIKKLLSQEKKAWRVVEPAQMSLFLHNENYHWQKDGKTLSNSTTIKDINDGEKGDGTPEKKRKKRKIAVKGFLLETDGVKEADRVKDFKWCIENDMKNAPYNNDLVFYLMRGLETCTTAKECQKFIAKLSKALDGVIEKNEDFPNPKKAKEYWAELTKAHAPKPPDAKVAELFKLFKKDINIFEGMKAGKRDPKINGDFLGKMLSEKAKLEFLSMAIEAVEASRGKEDPTSKIARNKKPKNKKDTDLLAFLKGRQYLIEKTMKETIALSQPNTKDSVDNAILYMLKGIKEEQEHKHPDDGVIIAKDFKRNKMIPEKNSVFVGGEGKKQLEKTKPKKIYLMSHGTLNGPHFLGGKIDPANDDSGYHKFSPVEVAQMLKDDGLDPTASLEIELLACFAASSAMSPQVQLWAKYAFKLVALHPNDKEGKKNLTIELKEDYVKKFGYGPLPDCFRLANDKKVAKLGKKGLPLGAGFMDALKEVGFTNARVTAYKTAVQDGTMWDRATMTDEDAVYYKVPSIITWGLSPESLMEKEPMSENAWALREIDVRFRPPADPRTGLDKVKNPGLKVTFY